MGRLSSGSTEGVRKVTSRKATHRTNVRSRNADSHVRGNEGPCAAHLPGCESRSVDLSKIRDLSIHARQSRPYMRQFLRERGVYTVQRAEALHEGLRNPLQMGVSAALHRGTRCCAEFDDALAAVGLVLKLAQQPPQ